MSEAKTMIETKHKGSLPAAAAPWYPFSAFRNEVDQLFSDFMRRPFGRFYPEPSLWPEFNVAPLNLPAVDVVEHDKEFVVTAEIPGMDEKSIEVGVSDDLLTLHGEKTEEKKEEKENYRLAERHFGSFHREIRIPPSVDTAKIEASYRKGILTVTLPKTPEAQKSQRKINVKT